MTNLKKIYLTFNMDTIIEINDILVSSEIVSEYFACDYEKCKGICCIVGDSGAPLKEYECEDLERNYSEYKNYLTDNERKIISKTGFFDIDIDGDIVTPLMGKSQECAYSQIDKKGNCFCGIELSYLADKSKFRKPISCSLYPIRVSTLSNGNTTLNLHRWNLCKDAYIKGRKENIRVYEFLKNPLVETYGQEFWDALDAAAKVVNV